MRNNTEKIALSGMFIAIAIILPEFFPTQSLRILFLPMHIPVFVAGLLLGWKHGLLIGVVSPLLRSVLLGMPPMFPTAVSMALELGVYGAIIGLSYEKIRLFKEPIVNAYLSLIIAMIVGRVAYGLFQTIYLLSIGSEYGLKEFFTVSVANGLPGILIQLLMIPSFILLLRKRGIGQQTT